MGQVAIKTLAHCVTFASWWQDTWHKQLKKGREALFWLSFRGFRTWLVTPRSWAEHHGGSSMWQRSFFISWWTGSREQKENWAPAMSFNVIPPVVYFLKLGPTT
jgi:hypothetical protein